MEIINLSESSNRTVGTITGNLNQAEWLRVDDKVTEILYSDISKENK